MTLHARSAGGAGEPVRAGAPGRAPRPRRKQGAQLSTSRARAAPRAAPRTRARAPLHVLARCRTAEARGALLYALDRAHARPTGPTRGGSGAPAAGRAPRRARLHPGPWTPERTGAGRRGRNDSGGGAVCVQAATVSRHAQPQVALRSVPVPPPRCNVLRVGTMQAPTRGGDGPGAPSGCARAAQAHASGRLAPRRAARPAVSLRRFCVS